MHVLLYLILGTDRTTMTQERSSDTPPPCCPSSLLHFYSSQTLDARLLAAIATPPKFRSPGFAPRTRARPVPQNVHPFLPISHTRSCTRASSDVPRLQFYLHLDRVSRLVPGGGLIVIYIQVIPSSHLPVSPSFQLCRHVIPRPLFKMASRGTCKPEGEFSKSFGPCLCGTSCGTRPGPPSARLPVLAEATWPCAWLLPCTGSAPRHRPFQLPFQLQGELGQPSMAGALSGHAPPALPESLMISPAPHASTNTA
jgi:hypothetical protein